MGFPYQFIAIEGVIGAGKTTLCEKLAQKLNATEVKEEFAENSFLEKFYKNQEQFAFPLEVSFLVERFNQMETHFSSSNLFKPITISDYLFDKSYIFGKNNLREDHLKLFNQIYFSLKKSILNPDILIFIHNNVENLQKNIKKRGRVYEQEIKNNYLLSIQETYLEYFKYTEDFPIVMIDGSKMDFLAKEEDINIILYLLTKEWKNGLNIINS